MTTVPVAQSLSWAHGVLNATSLESETTAATLGDIGKLSHSPMANMDFISIPLGTYTDNYLKMGNDIEKPPKIFSVNYFLKENGQFLNGKLDKKVWLIWMESRVNGDFGAIKTPVGYIPEYEDLHVLFSKILDKDYTKDEYDRQFAVRIDSYIEKFERIKKIFSDEENVPSAFTVELNDQLDRLREAREKFGKGIVSPGEFA